MKLEDRPFVRGIVLRWKDLQRGVQKRDVMRKLECGHVVVEREGGRSAQAKTALCTTCKVKAAEKAQLSKKAVAAYFMKPRVRRARRKTQPPPFSWARVWAKYGVQGA